MPEAGITLMLIPSDDGLEPDDELFLDQVGLLRRELREADIEVKAPPSGSGKGTELALPIIETVITGGAGLATIGLVVREWIKRRGRRAVRFVIKSDGHDITCDLTAKNLSEDAVLAVLKDVLDGKERP